MTTGGRSTPEHARDREAPHVGVDDGDRVAPLGQRDGQVGGDRRLADAALARGDEQHAGLATPDRRTGWPDPRRGRGPGGCRRWPPGRRGASRGGAARSSSVMTVKSRSTRVDAVEGGHRAGDPVLDLVAQRAAGDGEGDLHVDPGPVDARPPRTMSRSTMLRCSSGSSTGRSASMTSASVTGMAGSGIDGRRGGGTAGGRDGPPEFLLRR